MRDRLLAVVARWLARATALHPARAARGPAGAAELTRLLAPAGPTAHPLDDVVEEAWAALTAAPGPLGSLQRALGLDDISARIVAALAGPALAPELDRAYGLAAGDPARRRPDPALLAFLIGGADPARRDAVLDALEPGAPLRRHQLITFTAQDAPLPVRPLRLADRIVDHLRGRAPLDESLAAACRVVDPAPRLDALVLPDGAADRALRALGDGAGPTRLLLVGPDGIGKATLACAAAGARGIGALRVDVAALGAAGLGLAAREAALRGALLVLESPGELALDAALELPIPVAITATTRPGWLIRNVPALVELELAGPGLDERAALWQRALPAADPAAIAGVAARYSFGGASIESAARRAAAAAWLRGDPAVTADDLSVASRQTFSHRLGELAQRIPAGFGWDDLVLPDETLDQLRDVVRFAHHRAFLLERWGFARKLPYGRGLSALLAGPPGTGKTMVAQLLAAELGHDLYRIDLAQVVDKYIGETEKNLGRIFDEATRAHAILFFDEADALFAKRTDVRSSNDRYANLEVNYLLQRMETHDGVTLLATNLDQGIDEAFRRRVGFAVQFELPDADQRARLWRSMFPPEAPLAAGIDWDALADRFTMAGGYIKKAALHAATLAAEERRPIRSTDLWQAALREYRAMGRVTAG